MLVNRIHWILSFHVYITAIFFPSLIFSFFLSSSLSPYGNWLSSGSGHDMKQYACKNIYETSIYRYRSENVISWASRYLWMLKSAINLMCLVLPSLFVVICFSGEQRFVGIYWNKLNLMVRFIDQISKYTSAKNGFCFAPPHAYESAFTFTFIYSIKLL